MSIVRYLFNMILGSASSEGECTKPAKKNKTPSPGVKKPVKATVGRQVKSPVIKKSQPEPVGGVIDSKLSESPKSDTQPDNQVYIKNSDVIVPEKNSDSGDLRTLCGNYRLMKALGKGGSAQVFLAEDLALQRKVAVKLLLEAGLEDQSMIRLFQNEGRTLADLKHPAIVTVFSVEEDVSLKFPFLVMEFFDGQPLDCRAKELRTNPGLLFRKLIEILEAIHACHTNSEPIIHRDLKPSNILINDHNEIKIIDFGISRTGSVDLLEGNLAGTLEYMAPELFLGEQTTAATDIYALGALFWELISSSTPFQPAPGAEDIFADMHQKHCNDVPATAKIDDIPWAKPLTGLLASMLAKKPAERPGIPEIVSGLKQAILANERRIGDLYKMESLLGADLNLEVYRAQELKVARQATIKMLNVAGMKNPLIIESFSERARKLGLLNHSCLPKIFSMDRDPNTGNLFCVMSAATGKSLRELLPQLVHQPQRMCQIVQQIASGVEACLEAGFNHGKVDLDNVLVDKDDQVLLADYFKSDFKSGSESDFNSFSSLLDEILEYLGDTVSRLTMDLVAVLSEWLRTIRANEKEDAESFDALAKSLADLAVILRKESAQQADKYDIGLLQPQKKSIIERLCREKPAGALAELTSAVRNESDPEMLVICIQAIAEIGEMSQIPLLTEFLGHTEALVRRQAIKILADFEHAPLCLWFFRALTDSDCEVKKMAGHALKVLGADLLQDELHSFALFGAPQQQADAARALRLFPADNNRHLIEFLAKSQHADVVAAAGRTLEIWGSRAGQRSVTTPDKREIVNTAGPTDSHFIVCGYGSKGSLFADDLIRAGKKVVVIDDNLSSREHIMLKRKNLAWVCGSALDPVVLENAGVLKASHLIALTGKDDVNLEIGLRARALRQRVSSEVSCKPLLCLLHLYHHHRRRLFYRYVEAYEGESDELRTFSVDETAARQIVQRFSPDQKRLVDQINEKPVKILIVGQSSLAMVLCVQLAKHLQGPRPGLLEIVVLGSNIAAGAAQFRYLFPAIEQVVSLRFEENDARTWLNSCSDADGWAAIYCFPDKVEDGKALLAEYAREPGVPENCRKVMVWSLTGQRSADVKPCADWDFYDYPGECCTTDVVMTETQDIFARALHSHYCDSLTRRGATVNDNPNLVAWDMLPGEIKDANRSQADHILVKLRTIGCSIGRSTAGTKLNQNEIDILAQIEHRRWVVEKLLHGWKYGSTRDNLRQTHPNLLPWEALAEEEKAKNRIAVMRIPDILALAGCGISRNQFELHSMKHCDKS